MRGNAARGVTSEHLQWAIKAVQALSFEIADGSPNALLNLFDMLWKATRAVNSTTASSSEYNFTSKLSFMPARKEKGRGSCPRPSK
jgi:hypothetical protein